MQASYHSPLEGESQKPSRQAKADAVGGGRRGGFFRPCDNSPSWHGPQSEPPKSLQPFLLMQPSMDQSPPPWAAR